MSDPMTNTEVEDVLSSIRRLVSDEKRAEPAAKAAPASDRLVLTPSLRVLDEDVSDVDISDHDISDHDMSDHDDQPHGDLSEDGGDDAPDYSAEDHIAEERAQDAYQVDVTDDVQPDDDIQQDDADSDPMVLHTPVEGDAADHAEVYHDDDMLDAIQDDADSADASDEHVAQPPETLGEKIAALETLIAARTDEWEPDEAGSDPYAGTQAPAMAWEDAEEDAPDAPQPDIAFAPHVEATAATDEEAEMPIFSGDDDILDEDALRELVSDIVREELQGALGERITRNVRKLVRREIHRALAAQDLE